MLKISDFHQKLFLVALIAFSIIGTFLIQKGNTVLLLMVVGISLTVLAVNNNRLLSERNYPLAIFCISLALLLGRSLINPYLSGTDIHREYYFTNLSEEGHWNLGIENNINAMLSVTIIPVVYSKLIGINIETIYKIVYQILYSFVPLICYLNFSRQVSKKKAFLASFFICSMISFHGLMFHTTRQQIAEIFYTLILMIIFIRNTYSFKNIFLLCIFGFGVIISHYAINYILIATYVLYLLVRLFVGYLRNWIYSIYKYNNKLKYININNIKDSINCIIINPYWMLLILIMTLIWMFNVANSSLFTALNVIISKFYNVILSSPFNIEHNEAFNYFVLLNESDILTLFSLIFQIIGQILIVIGVLSYFINKNKDEEKYSPNYYVYSLAILMMLFLLIILPVLVEAFNVPRIYHVALLTLSPFIIQGINSILWIGTLFSRKINLRVLTIRFSSIFVIILFLFEIGFIQDITNTPRYTAVMLSTDKIMKTASVDDKIRFYSYYYTAESDVYGAKWISDYKPITYIVYGDEFSRYKLTSYGNISPPISLFHKILVKKTVNQESIIFISFASYTEGITIYRSVRLLGSEKEFTIINIEDYDLHLLEYKIYSSKYTNIYNGNYININ